MRRHLKAFGGRPRGLDLNIFRRCKQPDRALTRGLDPARLSLNRLGLLKLMFRNMAVFCLEDPDMIKANPITERLDQDQTIIRAFCLFPKARLFEPDRFDMLRAEPEPVGAIFDLQLRQRMRELAQHGGRICARPGKANPKMMIASIDTTHGQLKPPGSALVLFQPPTNLPGQSLQHRFKILQEANRFPAASSAPHRPGQPLLVSPDLGCGQGRYRWSGSGVAQTGARVRLISDPANAPRWKDRHGQVR